MHELQGGKRRVQGHGAVRGFAVAAALVISMGAAASVSAQPSQGDDPVTRALRLRFAEGRSLEAVGRWADALIRFEEIARARPTAHVKFHVGLCLDHLGRLRRAAELYRAALDGAGDASEVVQDARARLRDVEARTPRVIVRLSGADKGVTLLLDGEAISPAIERAADPGPHVVVAKRDGAAVAAAAFSARERRITVVPIRIYPPAAPSRESPIARATPSR